MKLTIEIVSDLICPWCYIGKARLDDALQMLHAARPDVSTHVTWLPFELNPQMPPKGLDRKTYRSAKFGSWARSQELDAGVTQAGAEAGIAFDFEKMDRTPNTLDGHRLLWLALGEDGAQGLAATQGADVQNALSDAFFRAYFVEGQNLNDRAVLTRLAAGCGLDAERVAAFLEGDEGADAVRGLEGVAQRGGVSGVPFLLFNGKHGVSGAQPADTLLSIMQQILDAPDEPETNEPEAVAAGGAGEDCEGGACRVA